MRRFHSVDVTARWLLSALGVAAASCGGSSEEAASPRCKNPQPILVGGKDTGVDQCEGGMVRRRAAVACPYVPRAQACSATDQQCQADTDCADQPNGYCRYWLGGGGAAPKCACAYGCSTDADCAEGQRCLCGDPVGQCVPADCGTSAECGDGLECVTPVGSCVSSRLACQTRGDECSSAADCQPGMICVPGSSGFICAYDGCAGLGRPFLVGGLARVAAVTARADFALECAPQLEGLTAGERAELDRHWTAVGLMEHASIAAFARFTLQLLGLGAPVELVEASTAAQADETRHARIAFALASSYAGAPRGPGTLDLDGALPPLDAERVLCDVIREGCIGETLAATEAAHAAAHAEDPVLAGVLSAIAEEESRHAELAWRFVRWLVRAEPRLVEPARRAFADAIAHVAARPLPPPRLDAERYRSLGACTERERAELHRDALDRAVAPCAAALLDLERAGRTPRPSILMATC